MTFDLGYTKNIADNLYTKNGATDLNLPGNTIAVPSEVKIMDRLDGIIQHATLSSDEKCNEIYKIREMVNFVNELNNDEYRQQFENDKNRLITLMAKNQNIYSKLNSKKINFYIFLGVFVFYTIGLSFIYLQTALLTKDVQAVILIGLSVFVLIMYAFVDIYDMVTRKHYEEFSEEAHDCSDVDAVNEVIQEIIADITMFATVEEKLVNNERNTQKKEIVRSILQDFNNVNYVNMRRYQLTDYKINETRSNMHFVKYAFLLVSVVGLLAGLQLRTELGVPDNFLPISKGFLTITTVFLILTYIAVFFLHRKQNMMRKKYNWNKLYWNVRATHNN